MKLSDAIRLGAMMKPQARGHVFVGGGTCAWGSAFDAIGKLEAFDGHVGWDMARSEFPICDSDHKYHCPACGHSHVFTSVVICLNDSHSWTREQIADWVATIEPVEQSTVADASELSDAVACPVDVQAVCPRA